VATVSSESFAYSSRAGIVERHVLCATVHRASCTSLNLPRSAPQSIAVFNKLWKQKLINGFNYCLQKTLTLKVNYSDIIVKLVLHFLEIIEN